MRVLVSLLILLTCLAAVPANAESAIGLITNMAASAPYEELRLKGK